MSNQLCSCHQQKQSFGTQQQYSRAYTEMWFSFSLLKKWSVRRCLMHLFYFLLLEEYRLTLGRILLVTTHCKRFTVKVAVRFRVSILNEDLDYNVRPSYCFDYFILLLPSSDTTTKNQGVELALHQNYRQYRHAANASSTAKATSVQVAWPFSLLNDAS